MDLLAIAQIVISVLLIGSILFQQQSAGSSAIFGGSGGTYFQRRGTEKFLFLSTIILGVIFFGLAILNLII